MSEVYKELEYGIEIEPMEGGITINLEELIDRIEKLKKENE